MRLTMIGAAVGLMVLAGCDSTAEPAQPPTQEDALTTATAAPATSSDEVEATTEAAPTTDESVETQEEPDGQTEEGAERAVVHYIETLGAVHSEDGDIEQLRQLATAECQTCAAFVEAAERGRFGHEYMRYLESDATLTGDQAVVHTDIEQVSDGARIDLVFTADWEGERWLISKIQVPAS